MPDTAKCLSDKFAMAPGDWKMSGRKPQPDAMERMALPREASPCLSLESAWTKPSDSWPTFAQVQQNQILDYYAFMADRRRTPRYI
jgi:hypothetical protein